MKKILVLGFILFFNMSLLAIVPADKSGKKIPENMLENLKKDPNYYMLKRGFLKPMLRFKEKKAMLNKVTGAENNTIKMNTMHIPVLCGKYADVDKGEWSVSSMQRVLFGQQITGSLSEYYTEISYGQFSVKGKVSGWFNLSENSEYYNRDSLHTSEFIEELCALADDDIDFGLYDNDGPDNIPNSGDDDGYVDVIAFIHSGLGGEQGGPEIWSHSTKYADESNQPLVTNDICANGGNIKIEDYIIQPALYDNDSEIVQVRIGVFCHELGHALGLPDLYDYDYSSEGVGNWCLMGGGAWGGDSDSPEYPVHLCAWAKEQLGWITPIELDGNLNEQAIPPVEDEPVVYKLWTHYNAKASTPAEENPYEYFLIENRQKKHFDQNLWGSGLLIWHVNNLMTGNDDELNKLVDLEEADGKNDIDFARNRGDAGDIYPGIKNNFVFS